MAVHVPELLEGSAEAKDPANLPILCAFLQAVQAADPGTFAAAVPDAELSAAQAVAESRRARCC